VDRPGRVPGITGSDPWINDLSDPASVFHPTLAGYIAGYYAKLDAALG
jgi:hypothetical protein